MGMGEAVNSVLRQNYANFSGRARRSEFWYFVLFNLVVGIVLGVIRLASNPLGLALEGIWGLATIVPSLAVSVRRLHDTGRSGWLTLLYFPFGFLVVTFIVVVIFWAQDSKGDNEHGPSPKGGGYGGGYAPPPAGGAYPPPPGSSNP